MPRSSVLHPDGSSQVKFTEAEYLNLGYQFEKALNTSRERQILVTLREKIEQEDIEDRGEARRLVGRGRQEARESR